MRIYIDEMAKDFERAKELLLGAVDTIFKMADHISSQAKDQNSTSSPASSLLSASCSGGNSHSSVLGATASSSGFQSAGLGAGEANTTARGNILGQGLKSIAGYSRLCRQNLLVGTRVRPQRQNGPKGVPPHGVKNVSACGHQLRDFLLLRWSACSWPVWALG